MTKKLLLISALCFTFIIKSNAQFGVKVGVVNVMPTMSLEGLSAKATSAIGLQAGVYYTHMFSEKLGIQPEALVTFASQNKTTSSSDPYKLTMINVPVMLKYVASEKISLLAGPQLDYLLKFTDAGEDIGKNMSKIGMSIGLGAEYNINESLTVAARYSAPITGFSYTDPNLGAKLSLKSSILGLSIIKHFSSSN